MSAVDITNSELFCRNFHLCAIDSTNLCLFSAVIPLQHSLTSFHDSFIASETAFWGHPSSSRLNEGLGTGPATHWNQDFACFKCVWGHCLVKTSILRACPLQRMATWPHQVLWRMQTDPWCAMNWHKTAVGETCPCHDACSTCFSVFTVFCGLSSEFGGCLKNWLRPRHPKRAILLSSVHKMCLHFSLGRALLTCFLANCNFFSTCFILTEGLCRGFLGIG